MRKIFIFKIVVVFLFISLAAMGQHDHGENVVHGFVYEYIDNDTREALPGVNVYWSGTTKGTVTSATGHFEIEAIENAHYLVFSYVGYANDTLHVHASKESLVVELKLKNELKEVEIVERSSGTHINRLDPIITQNVTSAELKKAACCNLSESFETNASVDVSFSDAVSGAKQIQMLGLRGLYSQLMTENIPNLRGLASAYSLSYIPGTWMESIQISKGTASVKNGYESITGQINVEYKKPDNEVFFFNAYANHLGKLEGNMNSSIKINDKWSTIFFLHGQNSTQKHDKNGDSFLDMPSVNQINFFNRWKYENEGKMHGQIGFKVLDEERKGGQMDFSEESPMNAYGTNIKTRRYEGFTKTGFFIGDLSNIGFINNFVYHDMNSYFGMREYSGEEMYYYGNLMFQSFIDNTQHSYTVGISYLWDQFKESLNDSVFNRIERVPGVFGEYTYILPDKITLVLGARSDFHNLYGTLFTPRVHFQYCITKNTALRASAGRGYRSPNMVAENMSLLANSRTWRINYDADIEEAWNYGINILHHFDVLGKELNLYAEYYYTNFEKQLIIDRGQDISSIHFYNLDGESYSHSFQFEASYEPVNRLEVTAAFRFIDARQTQNGVLVMKDFVSKYKGLVNLSYATNLNKWQFDLTAQFNGKSNVPSTAANPIEYQRPSESPAYTIINAQITKNFKKWELYAGVENLTDFKQENPIIAADDPFGEHFDASMIWGPIIGRKAYIGVRYTIKR